MGGRSVASYQQALSRMDSPPVTDGQLGLVIAQKLNFMLKTDSRLRNGRSIGGRWRHVAVLHEEWIIYKRIFYE
jgi:hypothetical protein